MQIYSAFALICPIRDKGKLAGCFGSYGWSGEAKHIIEGALQNLKLEVFPDGVFVKFTPSADDLKKAAEYGFNFGKKMRENSFSCKG
jgi:flavorubredoxin